MIMTLWEMLSDNKPSLTASNAIIEEIHGIELVIIKSTLAKNKSIHS